ncbi:hypothetical protein KI688_007082 [Linnemannia hyalina]|uniref:Galactose oxidase n=1 Tax=Linnemannia hyalina TaxID=64524 RepID=A0A9P7XJ69_9FUNG|nr:hypothetical protein KI688_007082 [Linnemannia hyalina]
MSYASLDEKTLYIQGGFTTVGTQRTQVNQFAALDLTVPSWPTSSPPWMIPPYKSGIAPNSSWHSMAVSKDHANLFLWDPFNTGWSTFNIADRTWTNFTLPVDATRQLAIRSAVDYNTGYVYAPTGTSNGTQMAMNALFSAAYTTSAMPTDLMPVPINHETFVWSTVRGTFLHYGGKTMFGNNANPYLNEYSPTNGWSRVTTSGPSPGDLNVTENSSSAIYILDVKTAQWTAGKVANVNQARCNMACAVAGDSFIAWGGDNKRVNMDAAPIVYNLVSNEWSTQFNLVSPVGPSPPTPSGPNYAAIGGGVAGAIALLGLVAFLVKRHKRNKRKKGQPALGHEYQETRKSSEDSVTPFTGAPKPPKSEPVSQAYSKSQQQLHHYQQEQEYNHRQQYQYQPTLEPRPMLRYESRPQTEYHSQHQNYYSSHVPAFSPYTPAPPPLQPRPTQQQDYVPMSPIEFVATTANVTPEESVSVYSPTSTFGHSSSGGYTRDVNMFSPTASIFAQNGGYSRDVKPISPTNEYAPATSAQFRTSKDPHIYMGMTYTSIPGNPQFIPAPPPAEPTTTIGTPRQNPQLHPEPGPSDENSKLNIV